MLMLFCSVPAVYVMQESLLLYYTYSLACDCSGFEVQGYEPEDWHGAVCQAVQMHHVLSSLWSDGLEAKRLARFTEVVCFRRAVKRQQEMCSRVHSRAGNWDSDAHHCVV